MSPRALRPAFVVTVTIALTSQACIERSYAPPQGRSGGGGGSCVGECGPAGTPSCPPALPAEGSACSGPIGWSYETLPDCKATCEGGQWYLHWEGCNPPPTDCPLSKPEVGEPCNGWDDPSSRGLPDGCAYSVETACGESTVVLTCEYVDGEEVWTALSEPGPCHLPPAECHLHDEPGCAADPSCQWLEAGCGDNPIATGCHAAIDCPTQTCWIGSSCTTVSVHPCPADNCSECTIDLDVCVAD